MQFQFNSKNNINADQGMAITFENIVKADLERFGERVMRVEIHVSDENSRVRGGGDDKKCVIEVRLAGLDPRSTSHTAESFEEAVRGSSQKMRRKLDTVLGKLEARKR